eukprot:7283478-Pyramimonas_sp.AAC.1
MQSSTSHSGRKSSRPPVRSPIPPSPPPLRAGKDEGGEGAHLRSSYQTSPATNRGVTTPPELRRRDFFPTSTPR